jgi:hypothetical protein
VLFFLQWTFPRFHCKGSGSRVCSGTTSTTCRPKSCPVSNNDSFLPTSPNTANTCGRRRVGCAVALGRCCSISFVFSYLLTDTNKVSNPPTEWLCALKFRLFSWKFLPERPILRDSPWDFFKNIMTHVATSGPDQLSDLLLLLFVRLLRSCA